MIMPTAAVQSATTSTTAIMGGVRVDSNHRHWLEPIPQAVRLMKVLYLLFTTRPLDLTSVIFARANGVSTQQRRRQAQPLRFAVRHAMKE